MEILTGSDALESQILEDARAKAYRILEAADRQCAAIRADGERRRAQEAERLDAACGTRVAGLRQELATALPLDSMRTRLSFIQESVTSAFQELLAALPADEAARHIGRGLRRVAHAFEGFQLVITAAGMSGEEAKQIVAEHLPGARIHEVRETAADGPGGKGIVLETVDGRRSYRGTLQALVDYLLSEARQELVTALLGKEA
jgi:V/A-type H+-transporting ATPase subunit E